MVQKSNLVCFLIVTFNSQKHIVKCLDSILEFEPLAEILIVDNGSSDDTLEILENYSSLNIIQNEINMGFGKANNLGIKWCLDRKFEFVYLLNHDAYLVESICNKLLQIFRKSENLYILSPIHVNCNMNNFELNFGKYFFDSGLLTKYFIEGLNDDYYPMDFYPAASWFVRSDLFFKIGGFDPLFFHYGEDNNFLNRVKYLNLDFGIVPSLKIVHIGNVTKRNYPRNYAGIHELFLVSNYLVTMTNLNNLDYLNKKYKIFKYHLLNCLISFLTLKWIRLFNILKLIVKLNNFDRRILISREKYIMEDNVVFIND